MKATAMRKRPVKAGRTDNATLLVELCDVSAGRLVWSDGSITAFKPESVIGQRLTAQIKKAKKRPAKRVVVSGLDVSRTWGWFNGRWTVTDVS